MCVCECTYILIPLESKCRSNSALITDNVCVYVSICICSCVQPSADRVAQHLEIISKTFPTNQNSAHGIYD